MDVGEGIISLPPWAQLLATFMISMFAAGAGIWGFLSKRNESHVKILGGSDCNSCVLFANCRDPKKGLGYICNNFQSTEHDTLLKQIISNGSLLANTNKEILDVLHEIKDGLKELNTSSDEILKIDQQNSYLDNVERAVKERMDRELSKSAFIEHKRTEG